MSYFKLKFDCELSDYAREMIVKLYHNAHMFELTASALEGYWKKYNLPQPKNTDGWEELLASFKNNTSYCIQDDRGKLRLESRLGKESCINIHFNEALIGLDKLLSHYRSLSAPSGDDIIEHIHRLYEALVVLNGNLFYYQFGLVDNDDMTIDDAKMLYPNIGYFSEFIDTRDIVETIVYGCREGVYENAEEKLLALHSSVQVYNMLAGYTMLCALMMDAFCATLDYARALIHIQRYIQFKYHNCYLYRVEIPTTGVNETKPIAQRGGADHTTLMKIYLFDQKQKPVLLRIDLPHAQSEFLHVNISGPKGAKLSGDHYEFETDQSPEELNQVFVGLRESIARQTPGLFLQVDTDIKDEQKILSAMQKFVLYNEMSLKLLENKEFSSELKKVAGGLGFLNTKYNVSDVLTSAYHYFGGHPVD